MNNPFETSQLTSSDQNLDNIFTKPVETKATKKKRKVPVFFKILGTTFLVLLIITLSLAGYLYVYAYKPGMELLAQVQALTPLQAELKASIASKDLNKIKEQFEVLKSKKAQIQTQYQKFERFSKLPYAKDYYSDGNELFKIADEGIAAGEIVIKAIAPYQDFLGLTGGIKSEDKAGGQTTEERIAFLTESVEGLVPYFDELEAKVSNIDASLSKIDPARYPEELNGFKIQSTILESKQLTAQIHKLLKDGKPILTKTSWLLGKDKPRTYLLLFQNDAELRPTGGFWTAYGLLKVDKGKITPISSNNIYDLDDKFNSTIPAPRPIKAYHINVPYLNIRDMNLSPDFPTSAAEFVKAYEKVNGKNNKFDAIVAINTKVVVDLIKITGRIGVPGYGNFTPDPDKRCDGCPNVLYQMLWLAGKPRNYVDNDRKGFLGPLMHSTLANAMGQPKEKLGTLIGALLDNLNQKNMLLYSIDPEIQAAAVKANIAGSITETTDPNMDYLMLVDANMSSAKTNLFLKQKIRHEIISENGQVKHKVTVTYTNPSKASNCNLEKGDICLNAPKYRDWFRFYTTLGSKLEKMTGSEVDPVLYDESGKSVLEGFYGNKYPLYALSSTKTSVQYTSSVPASNNYTLLLQKQSGTKPMEYELVVNGQDQESFIFDSDKIIKLSL